MKKLPILCLINVLILGALNVCHGQPAQNKGSWSSMDPLSVPLKIREAWYKKGNLVPNPSFEQVKYHNNDNGGHRVTLKGWKIIGDSVQVTNTRKPNYDDSDAYKGNHAVKIVRSQNDKSVSNFSEGVLSNFIKVIPGNYDFHFDIRLKNIISDSRIKKRIGKGIDIHLQYYDKNKKRIKYDRYFPYAHKRISNSFKGFAFSNFFYIKNFKWGRVRGESFIYPFSVGDVPDSCRYIKIFLGLEIPGEMWVDNVSYHLSKWNFTPLERLSPFFQKKYDLTDLMIPAPQIVRHRTHLWLKHKNIGIYYKGNGSKETKKAISLLQKRFKRVHGNSPGIYKTNALSSSSGGLKIILAENQSPFSTTFNGAFQTIKGKKQGYFIRRKGENIYLGANTSVGLYYAACSLSQLIDYKHHVLDYADITDWPDFKGRTTKFMHYSQNWPLKKHQKELKKQLNEIDFYAFYKINTFYNTYTTFNKQWWQIGKFYKQFYKKVGQKIDQYGNILSMAIQLNPTYHFSHHSEVLSKYKKSRLNLFSYGTKGGFEKVKKALKPALDAGAKMVMFCADDFVPYAGPVRGVYGLFSEADKSKFINLAGAQAYMLNELKAWLDKKYGNIRLEFVPPQYSTWPLIDDTRGTAMVYFHNLNKQLDSSVILVWTGPNIRSLSYDMADIHRVLKVYKRKPMVWDNTIYARNATGPYGGYKHNYPKKAVMLDLFQPLDIQYPKNFPNYVDSRYYNNAGGISELQKISSMTFADFTWNPSDYNADFSLFKALVQYAGKKNAKLLLKFNDAYYRFVSTLAELKMDKRRHSNYKCNSHQKSKAKRQIKTLKKAFHALNSLSNKELKKELRDKMDSKISSWHKLCQ